MNTWVKIRLSDEFLYQDGSVGRALIGERSDRSVFVVSMPWDRYKGIHMKELQELAVKNARCLLDTFLDAPFESDTVGMFDLEPNANVSPDMGKEL